MKKQLLLGVTAASLLIYCSGNSKTDAARDDAGSEGTILAKVNGETLTLEDLKLQIPAEYRDQLRDEDIRDATDTWINTQLLAEQGRKKGLDKEHDVQAVIKFRTSDAIARRLVETEITQKTNISPAEVDSIYALERENYKIDKEQYRASHIIVASKEEADAIHKRLVRGDDFGKMASDYSLDRQSAAAAGDLGFFTIDQLNEAFGEKALGQAVEKLQVGAFSAPIQSKYGFHLIKVTDKLPAGSDYSPEEVKAKITDSLLTARQGQAFNALMDSLKKEAKIERFGPAQFSIPALPDSV